MPRPSLSEAQQHHQAGRFVDAEKIYRRILAQDPNNIEALHLLGVLAMQTGHANAAVDLIQTALRRRNNWPEALNNLGLAYTKQGNPAAAVDAFHRALAANAVMPEAHFNLGN